MSHKKSITDDDIHERFTYHPPSPAGSESHGELTMGFMKLAHLINSVCPDGREKSTVLTKLEEGKFWASAAIARNPRTR